MDCLIRFKPIYIYFLTLYNWQLIERMCYHSNRETLQEAEL